MKKTNANPNISTITNNIYKILDIVENAEKEEALNTIMMSGIFAMNGTPGKVKDTDVLANLFSMFVFTFENADYTPDRLIEILTEVFGTEKH